jgi:hypothetical protein
VACAADATFGSQDCRAPARHRTAEIPVLSKLAYLTLCRDGRSWWSARDLLGGTAIWCADPGPPRPCHAAIVPTVASVCPRPSRGNAASRWPRQPQRSNSTAATSSAASSTNTNAQHDNQSTSDTPTGPAGSTEGRKRQREREQFKHDIWCITTPSVRFTRSFAVAIVARLSADSRRCR